MFAKAPSCVANSNAVTGLQDDPDPKPVGCRSASQATTEGERLKSGIEGEWKGDWSDKSKLWEDHPSATSSCSFTVANGVVST